MVTKNKNHTMQLGTLHSFHSSNFQNDLYTQDRVMTKAITGFSFSSLTSLCFITVPLFFCDFNYMFKNTTQKCDIQGSTNTLTSMGNIESPVNLTPLSACLWTVGGRRCTRGEAPQEDPSLMVEVNSLL